MASYRPSAAPPHTICLPAPPRVGRAGPRRSLVPKFSAFLAEFRQDFGERSETTWRGVAGVPKNLQAEYVDIPVDQITTRLIDFLVGDDLDIAQKQHRNNDDEKR